jgi:hypothetical protein
VCQRYGVERVNMERNQEVATAGCSERGAAMAAARTLYPLAPLCLTSGSGPSGRVPSWMEADAAEADAPITVWWDYPPS